MTLGGSIGAPLAGTVIDHGSAAWGYAVAGASAPLLAATMLGRQRLGRRSGGPTGREDSGGRGAARRAVPRCPWKLSRWPDACPLRAGRRSGMRCALGDEEAVARGAKMGCGTRRGDAAVARGARRWDAVRAGGDAGCGARAGGVRRAPLSDRIASVRSRGRPRYSVPLPQQCLWHASQRPDRPRSRTGSRAATVPTKSRPGPPHHPAAAPTPRDRRTCSPRPRRRPHEAADRVLPLRPHRRCDHNEFVP